MNTQQLLHTIERLPMEQQQQVHDFVVHLSKQQIPSIRQRTVGEYVDQIRIYPDFDNPLPDGFWLGQN